MKPDPQNHFSDHDLDWLAFCYINDELEANELASFERLLSEVQSAREAVERAVNQQILISAGLHVTRFESNGSVSLAPLPERSLNSNLRRRWLVPKLVFAAAASLLFALVSWMQWGDLIPSRTPTEVADQGASISELAEVVENEEWIGNEEYANRLVDALVASDPGSEMDVSTDGEVTPVTLQGDWMQDVFSEFGEEWIEMEDFDESDLESTESDQSWG